MECFKLYSNRVFLPNRFGFVKYKPEVMMVCKVLIVGIKDGHSVLMLVSPLRETIG